MCELFAINTREPVVINGYLEEFFNHSVDHPHGWGFARLDNGLEVEKDPLPAHRSPRIRELLASPLQTRHAIAHIRKATHGVCTPENCHPFTGTDGSGRVWLFAHNGVIFTEERIKEYRARELGSTDSECVLLYMLDKFDAEQRRRGRVLNEDDLLDVIYRAVETLAADNKLNFILDNGTTTYVHSNTTTPTLHIREDDNGVVVSTCALGEGKGWIAVPSRRILAIRNGRVVATSPVHDHGFDNQVLLDWVAEQEAAGNGIKPIEA